MSRLALRPTLRQAAHYAAPAAASGPWSPEDWWTVSGKTCVAAYQPKGAPSLEDSYTNLANPGTYDATPGTAPSWDETNGWSFLKASSQYLDTGIVPAMSWSAAIGITGHAKQDSWVFGGDDGTAGFGLIANSPDGHVFYINAGYRIITSQNRTSGVFGIAGGQGYYNGSADGAAFSQSGTPTLSIYIGDVHAGYDRYVTANVQAFSIYSATLSGADMASLTTRINAI